MLMFVEATDDKPLYTKAGNFILHNSELVFVDCGQAVGHATADTVGPWAVRRARGGMRRDIY